MIKEVEALEKLDNTLCLNNNRGNLKFEIDSEGHCDCNDITEMVDCLDVIEKALLELQAIKEAKPNEALDGLKSLDIQVRFLGILDIPSWEKHLPIIKQALLKVEKLEKVWEIVNEKNVDVYLVRVSKNAEFYNKAVARRGNIYMFDLTQEEFELLKEMLQWID